MKIKSALLDAVRNNQAVLFAGAGISWKAIGFGGIHIRDQLGWQIQRDHADYDPTSRSVEDVCDEYAMLNGRVALVDRLSQLIPQNCPPQPSHIAAA